MLSLSVDNRPRGLTNKVSEDKRKDWKSNEAYKGNIREMEMTKKFVESKWWAKETTISIMINFAWHFKLQLKSGSKVLGEDPESFHMGRKVSMKKGLTGVDCTQYVAVNCDCILNTLLHWLKYIYWSASRFIWTVS